MKGFIGGIPVALLAVAAQAQFVERQEHGFHPHPQAGGTAIGGPSGHDDGESFSPYSANIKTNTQVNGWSKDDHSIDIKHKDVYNRPRVAFGHPATQKGPQVPGMGPFSKRSAPYGGTAIGGPSGNDEGQSFDMPITGDFNTAVNDYNKDDHSIELEHENVHAPHVHPPPRFNGSPRAALGADSFEKRFGPQDGGAGSGGPGGSHRPHGPQDFPHAPHGGTAIGGPSGNDGGQSFSAPINVNTNTAVNEHNEDDHAIGVHHHNLYPGSGPFRRSENAGPPQGGPPHGGPPHGGPPHGGPHGGPPHGGPHGGPPGAHFEPHPETHYAPHAEHHAEPHPEPHYEPHPEPHYENHPEPHTENHPEPHYEPSYSPSYKPHYEPHSSIDNEVTSLKNLNNGPAAGSIKFGRRGHPGPPGPPGGHFEPHPESHFEPHAESHVEPHPEPHFAPHPEPHYENHPEPHVHNHPEPHYAPHYSPSYEPHYEPHHSVNNELTSIKGVNNGPAAGTHNVGRRDGPGPHFEPHPESHFEPHAKSHVEPHPEPHYAPHPEPHHENHPEPHVHNHPEPHYAPHYSPTSEPHYEPHHSLHNELTSLQDSNNGPAAGSIQFGRRAVAPGGTAIGGPSGDDEGTSFSSPTNVGVHTGVNEDNEDDHSIKTDYTHVYPQAPAESYEDAPYNYESPAAPAEGSVSHGTPSAPQANVEAPRAASEGSYSPQEEYTSGQEGPDASQCSAEVREVIHTVTKTQYRTSEATPMAYQSAPAVESHGIPVANTPQQSAQVDPKMLSSASAPVPASSEAPYFGYNQSQRPMSQAASYSMIPVHVPMASSAPSGAVAMATPSNMGKMVPSGVSPELLSSPSSSAFATPSHGAMFEGAATRLSGGVVSAAAAVMGVLAFII